MKGHRLVGWAWRFYVPVVLPFALLIAVESISRGGFWMGLLTDAPDGFLVPLVLGTTIYTDLDNRKLPDAEFIQNYRLICLLFISFSAVFYGLMVSQINANPNVERGAYRMWEILMYGASIGTGFFYAKAALEQHGKHP